MDFYHLPIMLNECIDGLNIRPDGDYLDCTLGGGGHSSEICTPLAPADGSSASTATRRPLLRRRRG